MKKGKLKKQTISKLLTYAAIVIVYILVTIAVNAGMVSNLLQGLLVPICTYIILAVSLNLTVGILGELSLGHAGFMCVGAFSSALFSLCMQDTITFAPLRFTLAIIVSAIVAAIFGFLIGIPVLRLKGDYLAIVTLAFGEIIKNVINAVYLGRDSQGFHISLKDSISLGMEEDGQILIKGAQGITGTPNDSTFTVGVILIVITLFIVLNMVQSRTGRAIMAIRDNRIAAESIGINVTKYKLIAFTVSASLAGVGGALYAHNLNTLTALPKNFGYNMSIMILVFVVLGGIGNMQGSIIAAIILTLLPELLRGLNDYRMLIYAIVLIVMMLFNWSPKAREMRDKVTAGLHVGKKKKEGEA